MWPPYSLAFDDDVIRYTEIMTEINKGLNRFNVSSNRILNNLGLLYD